MAARAKKRFAFGDRCRTLTVSAITQSAHRTSKAHARPIWRKALVPLAIVLALFLAWRYTPLADLVTAAHVVEWSRAAGRAPGSPVLLILAYIVAAFVMFPRPVLTLLSIIAYGPWIGFGVSIAGIMASAVAVYYAGRALPKEKLHALGGAKLERTTRTLRKHGVLAAFAVSIVPVGPFPIVGMTAGAAKIGVWKFLAGVTLGMLPGTLATTLFADQILAALDEEAEVNYWIVAGAVVILIALIVIVRRWLAHIHK
jgi:uncharacterized membrane protein YdjX (TVP38/TMEM64 family)